jgi:hypothetical protein
VSAADLTAAVFEPLVGDAFHIATGDGAFDAELLSVTPTPNGFSLVFRAGQRDDVPQQIFRVRHDPLGELDIFLVPLGPDEVGMRYEAVFS